MEKDLMLIVVVIILAVLLFGVIFKLAPMLFKPQPADEGLRMQSQSARDQSRKIIDDSRTQYKTFMEKKSKMP